MSVGTRQLLHLNFHASTISKTGRKNQHKNMTTIKYIHKQKEAEELIKRNVSKQQKFLSFTVVVKNRKFNILGKPC